METPFRPLFGLRITTPRLHLPYADDELVAGLAALAAEGIHDADTMPFSVPWTRQPAGAIETQSMKFYWSQRATLTPTDWHVPFAVLVDGQLVGMQECFATRFPVLRTVQSGSWLGRAQQGKGIGTEMRAAMLHFAFAGLGAERAETSAWEDNDASIAVTRRHGYVDSGDTVLDREGEPTRMVQFRLTREAWEQAARADIVVHGLEPCRELLGALP